jgi:UDP-N-acetylmuramoyl-L-alanyl-D-glutamate--2,6-diaminopimelate ligase
MNLRDLVRESGISKFQQNGDANISGICSDSRKVKPGDLFVAYPSASGRDSAPFLSEAIQRGAVACVVLADVGLDVPTLVITDFEDNIWRLCAEFYREELSELRIVGVTGTNGKTTVAWLVRDILTAMGHSAGYLGTLGFSIQGMNFELSNTTPFVVETYGLLAKAASLGAGYVAMEMSSHALAQKRVEGLKIDSAVFTNLTQDHLDFHETMENYAEAKWRLFSNFAPASASFNEDDLVGIDWKNRFEGYSLGFGSNSGDLKVIPVDLGITQTVLRISFRGEWHDITVPLGGSYNVSNVAAAVAAVLGLGFSYREIARILHRVRPVPGRFEPVNFGQKFDVIVDYAHTPDALEKLLESLRPLVKGKIITVFGCGGDRDSGKRSLMAETASERSDVLVVTSDNPRTEDPERILDDVFAGVPSSFNAYRIVDRPRAIAHAISLANPGDAVVIAGKGHETYQIVGAEKMHMDDRELVKMGLDALQSK